MNRKINLAIMSSWQVSGNFDCFSGHVKAFRLLGYYTDAIQAHILFKEWSEYLRFFGITHGVPGWTYTPEDIVEKASFNAVLQVMKSNPDVLIVIDGTSIHRGAWEWLRRLGIPTILIGTECPYQDKFFLFAAQMADKVYTNELTTAQRSGLDYLPVGYDSEAHHPMMVNTNYRHDVVFIGSGFQERIKILEAVDWDGIDFDRA